MYAEECKEPSGEACLYTDVAYNTCSMQAKASEFRKKKAVNGTFIYCVFLTAVEEKKLCVKLSDGTRRCSDSKGPETIIPS